MDANWRPLFAKIVEVDIAVVDGERLDRQVSKRRSFLRSPALRVSVRPNRAQIEIALRIHHNPDVGFAEIEFRNLRFAAEQREELDVDRHLAGGEKWFRRKCWIVRDRQPAHLDRHAPSYLRLDLADFDAAAEFVAHARKYSRLVARDDRAQIEVGVRGKRSRD